MHESTSTHDSGDAYAWAYSQFAEGVDAESIAAGLVENGWESAVAAEIAESARIDTLQMRVTTRRDVANHWESNYRSKPRIAGFGSLWLDLGAYLLATVRLMFRKRK